MAPSDNGTPVAPVPADGGNFRLSLEEFCTRLSGEDRRVEMIGAFHHAEKRAGRVMDLDANFRSRFHAFTTQPV